MFKVKMHYLFLTLIAVLIIGVMGCEELLQDALNVEVDFMQGLIPTTENFAAQIWQVLESKFTDVFLEKIVLLESENNSAEIVRNQE